MKTKKLLPIHPVEILSEDFMKPRDLSQNGLARALSVPPGYLNEIVQGRRAFHCGRVAKPKNVSPETKQVCGSH